MTTIERDSGGRGTVIAGLKAVRQHHEFTRDRVGQSGCEVRRIASEHVDAIDAAIEALSA